MLRCSECHSCVEVNGWVGGLPFCASCVEGLTRHPADTNARRYSETYISIRADGSKEVCTFRRSYGQRVLNFIAAHGMRCFYCGRKGQPDQGPDGFIWNKDHRVPRSRGGARLRGNVVLACRTCNYRKGDSDADSFQAWARSAYADVLAAEAQEELQAEVAQACIEFEAAMKLRAGFQESY